ncbi:MAG TPA: hypothetical protein VGR19_00785 [Allosphingosinicella sp.]|nr:hypothetical protein [Allosphingosinicella sp.]
MPAATVASKSALSSFLVCALLTLALYFWLHFGAVSIAETNTAAIAQAFNEPEHEVYAWLIEESRWRARHGATSLLIIFTLYWAISAIFGRGYVARSTSANVLLIFGVCAYLAGLLNSYYAWAETYCDVLPYPHEGFQLARIYECPSSFMFFAALWKVSLFLIICSLAARIVTSRKRAAKGKEHIVPAG